MSVKGAMVCVLATGLAKAVAEDEKNLEDFDISAGMFGPAVAAWMWSVADDFIACSQFDAKAD